MKGYSLNSVYAQLLPFFLLCIISVTVAAQTPPQYWQPRWSPFWQPARQPENVGSKSIEESPASSSPEKSPSSGSQQVVPATSGNKSSVLSKNDIHASAALEAMRTGNYAIAYYHWFPLAEAGDAEAQFGIGWMYHNGYGLVIDNKQTVQWWSRAAEQGYSDALFALGMLFAAGDDAVKRDSQRAADYYLKAARIGHEDARYMLKELITLDSKAIREVVADWREADWLLFGSPLQLVAERVNSRNKPTLKAEIVTVLTPDVTVLEISREGDWIEILIPDRLIFAWVHNSLVESK